MTSIQNIVRCIKSDIVDLKRGAEYCERISKAASMNPWSECSMANNYAEAARILRSQMSASAICPACRMPATFPNSATALSPERMCEDCGKG